MTLYQKYDFQMFPPILWGCLLTLMTVSSDTQQFLLLREPDLLILLPVLLVSDPRNYSWIQCHEAFLLCFLLVL